MLSSDFYIKYHTDLTFLYPNEDLTYEANVSFYSNLKKLGFDYSY